MHASAEALPLEGDSFDVVFADWGATTFADPYLFVPEVARVLRHGGLFAFSGATPLNWLCFDEQADTYAERLQQPYFGVHSWEAPEGVGRVQAPHGRVDPALPPLGLLVEDLIEVRPPEGAESTYRTAEETIWARRWPMEQIWKVRKP